MIIKIGRFRFGAMWEKTHGKTMLFNGRQVRFFISYETNKLREFRRRVMEANRARKTDEKGRVGKTIDDRN